MPTDRITDVWIDEGRGSALLAWLRQQDWTITCGWMPPSLKLHQMGPGSTSPAESFEDDLVGLIRFERAGRGLSISVIRDPDDPWVIVRSDGRRQRHPCYLSGERKASAILVECGDSLWLQISFGKKIETFEEAKATIFGQRKLCFRRWPTGRVIAGAQVLSDILAAMPGMDILRIKVGMRGTGGRGGA